MAGEHTSWTAATLFGLQRLRLGLPAAAPAVPVLPLQLHCCLRTVTPDCKKLHATLVRSHHGCLARPGGERGYPELEGRGRLCWGHRMLVLPPPQALCGLALPDPPASEQPAQHMANVETWGAQGFHPVTANYTRRKSSNPRRRPIPARP